MLDSFVGAAYGSSESSLLKDTLVHSLLDAAVAENPDCCAVRDPAGTWSYRQLGEFSHAVEYWLAKRGIGTGDRIVVQLPTTRELVALFYGAARRGVIFVPLNPAMKHYHLRSVLNNAEPALTIASDDAAEQTRQLATVPVHDITTVWREVEALHEQGARADPVDVQPDDIAVLIYTSGSTAAPKAVICPHSQATFATSAISAELGYRPDDVVFCRFPMSWDYGLYKVLLCCLGRAELVLADGESDLVLLNQIRDTAATIVPIVPSLATMIATLAARESEPVTTVRMFTNTGATLPKSTIDALHAFFPSARVVRQFGQTECKRISIMPPDQESAKPDSVGRPLPGTGVLILDEGGQPVPIGEPGEIVAIGPHVMPGYWRAPELTKQTFRHDERTETLRLHTGDYGRLDADGYLYFEGRRDDMFKRKGIRMSTIEIEAAAMDIPGVRAAAVLPPTEHRDVVLCVESDLSSHAVLRELAQRLEAAKVPALCQIVDDLPLTMHGKNERKRLALLLDGNDQ